MKSASSTHLDAVPIKILSDNEMIRFVTVMLFSLCAPLNDFFQFWLYRQQSKC